jgi:putative ABC transport system permease protein
MRELFARLRDWVRRDQLEDELAEELRFHRAALERDGAARRQLGNLTRITEESRDRWGLPWLDHLQQDVRYALRGLRLSPGFTTTVIVTLGLGIGANTAMFGLIDRLMFRADPYMNDTRGVHRVYLQTTGQRLNTNVSFPYARYLDLERWTTSFSRMAAFVQARQAVGVGDATRVRKIAGVGTGYFDFFDARPALGRLFLPHELALPAGANVAIISDAFWRTDLGQRDVIGEPLQVGDVAYTIVGVMPEGFVGISEGALPDVWLPITAYGANEGGGSARNYWERYNWDWTEIVVQRRAGVSEEAAAEDLTRAFIRSRQAARVVHPNYVQVERANPRALLGALKTAGGPEMGRESETLLWISGVAVIVLAIACANVANLFLARALRRRREIALRVALGVSRARLAAQSVTESLVLALLGCGVGILAAQWGGAAMQRLVLPYSTFRLADDWRTLGVAALVATVAGVATGLAPVLFAGRADPASALKAGVREGTHQRSGMRAALLITQAALSVVLLVGAGLFVRSLSNATELRLGYDVDPVMYVQIDTRGTTSEPHEMEAIQRRAVDAARAVPVVRGAALTTNTPMHGTSTTGLAVPGYDSVASLGRFTYQGVGPDYFDVIGTRIVRGRAITERDAARAPLVTVVSESMARTLWPKQDAIGRCIRVGFFPVKPDTMPCTTVVGVAEDVVNNFELDYPLRYYLPLAQLDGHGALMVVRTNGDAALSAESVRRAVQASLPGLSFALAQPLGELSKRRRRSWEMGAMMFAGFGVLALVVAAIGLYGVVGYNVAQRMHELGVRVALGAQRGDLARLVVGQGVGMAALGIAAGTVLALIASRWIEPLLFRQSARDPVVFAGVAVVLLFASALASLIPALRAMRVDPNTVLRSD